ncbi:MAG: hypothetical protein ACXAC6_05090 [Candidatus Hodarchaeales archaeon]|jgi:hypothetical protein
MTGGIAWVRLTLYVGSSILLLAEGIRFSLIYLGFIIQVTGLLQIIEALVTWILFLGYLVLVSGLFTLEKKKPPLLSTDAFNYQKLHRANIFGVLLCVLLLIFILTPPAGTGEGSATIFLQILLNLIWIFFYIFLIMWLLTLRTFTLSESSKNVIKERKFLVHLILIGFLICEWVFYTFGIIFFRTSVFVTSLFTPILSGTLVFFLLFQIYYFYKLSRFSYLIIG